MPTPRLSDEQRETLRLEELSDRRDFYAEAKRVREHELVVLDRKQGHAKKLAEIRYKSLRGTRKTVVWAITILALFNRPVPPALHDLLGS